MGTVDFTRDIEAVFIDGRVANVTPTALPAQHDLAFAGWIDGIGKVGFNAQGFPLSSVQAAAGWSIRNVQPESLLDEAAEARRICDASPYDLSAASTVTNGHIYEAVLAGVRRGRELRTSDEALRRMEALVERLAGMDAWSRTGAGEMRDEACAIRKLRAPPVDPRLAAVVTSLVQNGVSRPVAPLFARDVLKALDAGAGKA